MNDDLAGRVYPVFLYGLRLKERLRRGERPHLATEQAALKGMLGGANAPPPWGGGPDLEASLHPHRFLGIRYALACWLDEIFIDDSPWQREWDENKIESALFQTNIRYRNFWVQARLAETVPGGTDALEAFLLCVLFAFRGEMVERPEELRDWVAASRSRVGRNLGRELPPIPENTPESAVPALMGAERYRAMAQAFCVGVLALIPVTTFLLVSLFR